MSAAPPAPPDDLPARDYDRAVRRVALLLLAVGVFGRAVRYALNAPIWGDEAMLALNVVNRDFLGLTASLDYYQVAPVLFLWAERAVFLALGDGEWALRLLPFLAGLAALAAFWDFARRTVSPTAAALAVGLLAAARWPVVMSATLKPYSGDLFWAAVLLALAARWRQRPGRAWPLAVLAAVAPVAAAASYPVVFVGGAVAVYLLPIAWRHPARWARVGFAAYCVLLAGTFAACVALVGRGDPHPDGPTVGQFMFDYWRHGFPPDDPLRFPAWFLLQQAGRMSAYPIGDARGGSALTVIAFAAGVWYTWRGGNRPLALLCLVPFGLNLLAAVLHKYPYGGCCRLSQHLAPAVCLMAGVGWARLIERAETRAARLRAVWWSFAVLAAYVLGCAFYDTETPEYSASCRHAKNVYRELTHHLRPGDRVVWSPDLRADPRLCQRNQNMRWYVQRFRDRILPADVVPDPAAVPDRLWVLTLTDDCPAEEPGRDYLARVRAAGWVPVADVQYLHRPRRREREWNNCRVTCFHPPGVPPAPIPLNASP